MGRLRLGILGGTFDPVHLGHLILAEEACWQLKLDCVLWVLTPHPPHKYGTVRGTCEQRLQLLELATAKNPAFQFSRVDIDRLPPHYALDTMGLLHAKYPEAKFIYLIGSDSLRDLPNWYQPQALLAACDTLGVMRRRGAALDLRILEKLVAGASKKITEIDAPLLDISSSDIRQRIAEGRPYRYYLTPEEYEYISQKQLYAKCKVDATK